MRTLLTALASVLLLLAGSCTSPLASLKTGLPSLPPVGPGETQLVFHLNSSAKALDFYTTYSVSEVKYLVVQLHSKYGQGSKFASVAVTGTTVAVNIKGLVAGPWELLVSAYDWDGVTGTNSLWAGSQDNTQPTLLYTAMEEMSIKPGTSNSVNALLYKPGDLSTVELVEAKMVNSVVITGAPTAPLTAGAPNFTVAAMAWNVLNVTAASDQSFSWYSDNPDVAFVDNAGNVFPKNPGTTKITARSRESDKYGTDKFAQFTLTIDPAIVGLWKAYVTMPSPGYRYAWIKPSGLGFEIRYLTDVDSSMTAPSHYISTLGSTGSNAWQFDTNKHFDFASGTEIVSGGSTYSLSQNGNNQIKITLVTPPETITYDRVANPVYLSSVTLPAGPLKTGQSIQGKDLVLPGNVTVNQVYLNYSGGTAYSMSPYSTLRFDTAGPITVSARSVLDPSKFASVPYTVNLAAPPPSNLMAPVASVTDTSILLNWSYMNPGSLPGVNLYRSSDGGTTYQWLTGAPMAVNSYTDTGLTAGKEYLYYLVGVGGFSGSTYDDSVPSPLLSAYTTSGGVPVVVSGPSFNPTSTWMDNGNGVQVPSVYVSMPVMGYYGAQGFDNTATPVANLLWLRAGDALWMVYSLPLAGAPAATVVAKYQHGTPYGSTTVSGVSKVWSITGPVGNTFTLQGAGASAGTVTWNPPTMDFVTP